MTALIDYLGTLHGSTGFHEILTLSDRTRVAEIVSAVLDDPAQSG